MRKKYFLVLVLSLMTIGSLMAQTTYTLNSAKRDYTRGNQYYSQKDYVIAAALFKKAAEYGYAQAQNNLGWCYQKGLGVKQDYTLAAEWYRKSAIQGYAKAQNNLGYCYEHGYGVTQDYAMAHQWYSMALGRSRKAQKNLNRVSRETLAAEYGTQVNTTATPNKTYDADDAANDLEMASLFYILEDFESAYPLLVRASDYGNTDAQFMLGSYYYAGHGGKVEYEKAFDLFLKASKSGSASAQAMLGVCYLLGNGTAIDYTKSFEWFYKSASQGYASAQTMVGACYENGVGTQQSTSNAVIWYRKAAAQDQQDAQEALTRMGYSW